VDKAASRRIRLDGNLSKEFDKGVSDFGAGVVGDPVGLAFDVLHQSIKIVLRVGNGDHSNSGAVPQTAGIQLGNGNVEAIPQAVFQTAQHSPFVLERLGGLDVEFEGEKGDHRLPDQDTISDAGIEYGIILAVMETVRKITVEIPEELLDKARKASGAGITQTVRTGLQLVAASHAYARLRQLRGKVRFARTATELKTDR
jgi:hypothetical protein